MQAARVPLMKGTTDHPGGNFCRCMAISAAVFVGGIKPWTEALLARAQALSVGPGAASSTDVGPLISPEARDRAANLIQSGVDQVPTPAPQFEPILRQPKPGSAHGLMANGACQINPKRLSGEHMSDGHEAHYQDALTLLQTALQTAQTPTDFYYPQCFHAPLWRYHARRSLAVLLGLWLQSGVDEVVSSGSGAAAGWQRSEGARL